MRLLDEAAVARFRLAEMEEVCKRMVYGDGNVS